MVYILNKFISIFFFCYIYCHYNYNFINKTNYETLEYNSNNLEFILYKNDKNEISINDGFYIKFNNISRPKHLSFSFKLPYQYVSPYLIANLRFLIGNTNYESSASDFEGCDLRLTSINYDNLISNNFKTKNSDLIFFRIIHFNKINLNDLPIYIPQTINIFNETSYIKDNKNNETYIQIDIILNWKKKKAILFLNKQYIWNIASLDKTKKDKYPVKTETDFYHENFSGDMNKIILYNFKKNTYCQIKNLNLCEDFCNEEISNLYKFHISSNTVIFNYILLIIILIILK